MSRIATGDRVIVKPSNNIYTALAVVATLVNLAGFILIFLRYTAVFGPQASLFQH